MAVALGGYGYVSDAHPALIALYRAVAEGWDPPEDLSEAAWREAKSLPDSNPLKAFAGFGCSFGGKYFAGYARGAGRNWAAEARRAVLRDVSWLKARACDLAHVDFLSIEPFATDMVLYLDPPYAGTTVYSLSFDPVAFQRRVRQWARYTDVFVSEYSFPFGECVLELSHGMSVALAGDRSGRTERLYWAGPGSL